MPGRIESEFRALGAAVARRRGATLAAIVLACLAVAYCGHPWTKTQCLRDASQRPTPQGVYLARELCEQAFKS